MMATTNATSARFISHKLSFLRELKAHLVSAVEEYVDKIVSAGNAWIENGENKVDYKELGYMIDRAVEFIGAKCDEVSGTSANVIPDKLSQSLVVHSSSTSEKLTLSAAAAPVSTSSSYRHTTMPTQAPDDTVIRQVLSRIGVMEEALCSFRSNAEKFSEKHTAFDKQLNEISLKLSKSDKKQNKAVSEINEQMKRVTDNLAEFKEKRESRFQSLENQTQKTSAKQGEFETRMKSLEELKRSLSSIPDEIKSIKTHIGELDSNIDKIANDCCGKTGSLENFTLDLSAKVNANTEALQSMSDKQEQSIMSVRGCETRLVALEAGGDKIGKDQKKPTKESETNFKLVCQMLNNRLKPLEQLRKTLNDRIKARDDNVKKLCDVVKDVQAMSPRLQRLEIQSSKAFGFTARTWLTDELVEGSAITSYTKVSSNTGSHFNPSTGIFTAPEDGLYVASISLSLTENGALQAGVKHGQGGVIKIGSASVCESMVGVKCTTACGVGVVSMKAGDVLVAYMYQMDAGDSDKTIFFSCFKLG